MFGIDPLWLSAGGLAAGFVFGFLLQKGQVSKYRVIVGQFLMVDHTVLKIMLTAVFVGAVGIYGMLALGLIDHLLIKPALLLGVGLGGLIFGVGMTGLGYCPGTGVAAAGEGSRHAWFGILGGVFGSMVFAEAYPWLATHVLDVWDFGKVTFSDLTGLSPWVFVGLLGLGAAAAFALIRRAEQHPVT
jgi:hypothetical protein